MGNSYCGGTCNDNSSKGGFCEQRLTIQAVPSACATVSVTLDGISDHLDLVPLIQCAETYTELRWNEDRCRLEFLNEEYIASKGSSGRIQSVSAGTIASCMVLGDLADVSNAVPNKCDLLVWRPSDADCPNPNDISQWTPYTIGQGAIVSNVGIDADGCLVSGEDVACTPETEAVAGNSQLSYSGGTATAAGDWEFGPDDFTQVYTNDTGCDRFVRIDAQTNVSVGTDGEAFDIELGYQLESSIPDLGGNSQQRNYDHQRGGTGTPAGRVSYGAPQYMVVRVNAGQSATFKGRGYWRVNAGGSGLYEIGRPVTGLSEVTPVTIMSWRV